MLLKEIGTMRSNTLIVDVGDGWRYGFPRPVPEELVGDNEKIYEWLLSLGLPEHCLMCTRYWYSDNLKEEGIEQDGY
jgi:hypothetical protein